MALSADRITRGRKASPSGWCMACLMAAIGGMLPTASKLGATYVSRPETALPEPGLYVGLLIFAVIGAVLCVAFRQTELHKALIIGIAAPGIITNIVSGAFAATPPVGGDGISQSRAVERGVVRPSPLTRGIGHMRLSQTRRTINIKSDLVGNIDIRDKTIRISVRERGANTPRQIGSLVAGDAVSLQLSGAAEQLIFSMGAISTAIAIPNGQLRIQVYVQVQAAGSWKNDFGWAFGSKRYGTVRNITARIRQPT